VEIVENSGRVTDVCMYDSMYVCMYVCVYVREYEFTYDILDTNLLSTES
jgi:hypothetical protein